MKLIKDLGMLFPTTTSKKKSRYGIFECETCKVYVKRLFTRNISPLITECTDCVNSKKPGRIPIHGGCKTKLYMIYNSMKQRCYNTKNKAFKHYGGRGITICDEWRKDFLTFKKWAENSDYMKTLSIDRRDNDKGYSPENCRWEIRDVQARNTQKLRCDNTSNYRGVTLNKRTGRWEVRISVSCKRIQIGTFNTAREGALAYDKYVILNDLEHTLNLFSEYDGGRLDLKPTITKEEVLKLLEEAL